MSGRKLLNLIVLIAMAFSLMGGGINTAVAKDPPPPKGQGQTKDKKVITQKDREQAAARSLKEGALNPLMVDAAAAVIIDDSGVVVPRYFSHPLTALTCQK